MISATALPVVGWCASPMKKTAKSNPDTTVDAAAHPLPIVSTDPNVQHQQAEQDRAKQVGADADAGQCPHGQVGMFGGKCQHADTQRDEFKLGGENRRIDEDRAQYSHADEAAMIDGRAWRRLVCVDRKINEQQEKIASQEPDAPNEQVVFMGDLIEQAAKHIQ
jgi:hypothetical protein